MLHVVASSALRLGWDKVRLCLLLGPPRPGLTKALLIKALLLKALLLKALVTQFQPVPFRLRSQRSHRRLCGVSGGQVAPILGGTVTMVGSIRTPTSSTPSPKP